MFKNNFDKQDNIYQKKCKSQMKHTAIIHLKKERNRLHDTGLLPPISVSQPNSKLDKHDQTQNSFTNETEDAYLQSPAFRNKLIKSELRTS